MDQCQKCIRGGFGPGARKFGCKVHSLFFTLRLQSIERDANDMFVFSSNIQATNNLAVCELYAGQLNDAIPRIEKLMFAYPTSAGTSEPLVFNMATLYELRTEGSLKKKQQMLVEVSQWAGDQFNVGVFKL